MEDKKLLKWVFIILMAPLVLAYFSNGGKVFVTLAKIQTIGINHCVKCQHVM